MQKDDVAVAIGAETYAEKVAKHYGQVLIDSKQPRINPSSTLLATAYGHDELHLDLYGERDIEDGINVYQVTLTGSKVDLSMLFTSRQLEDMAAWCERKAAKENNESRFDAAIDAAEDRKSYNEATQ